MVAGFKELTSLHVSTFVPSEEPLSLIKALHKF